MAKKFYLTTPIYYVNGRPHIGHLYSTMAADVVARAHRQRGHEVLFSTGLDENSQKNVEAAQKAGKLVHAYVDAMAEIWRVTWQQLGLSYDVFIRTTSPEHQQAVVTFLKAITDKGDIYLGDYQGYYCVACEAFVAAKDLVDGRCPDHQTVPQLISEKNYFFRLSKYRQPLLDHFEQHPHFVEPASARHKILDYIRHEMADISVSRQAQVWGIRLPQDPSHAVYVWFDALINYLTVAGYPDKPEKLKQWWPADLHLIGKDIIKFHGAIWPAMLLSAGLPLPQQIFAHGFFTINGQKISKSLGNAIDPLQLVKEYPIDALRYYLLRDIPFGGDGDFSEQRLHERYNADLANGLGNFISRVMQMVENFTPDLSLKAAATPPWAKNLSEQVAREIDALAFDKALQRIWEVVAQADTLIEQTKPWQMYKAKKEIETRRVLEQLVAVAGVVAEALEPFLPDTAQKIKDIIMAEALRKPTQPLFVRKDTLKKMPNYAQN